MASLKTLKKRIQSVQSTRKITAAMRMVATSYYRRYQAQVMPLRHLNAELTSCLKTVYFATPLEGAVDPFVANKKPVTNHLILVLGTDRGLCGSFNVKLLNYTQSMISQLNEQGQKVSVLCVGHRLLSMISLLSGAHAVRGCDVDYKKIMDFIVPFVAQLKSLQRSNTIQACSVVYGSHESAIYSKPQLLSLMPIFKPEDLANKEDSIEPFFGSEPAPSDFMERFTPEIVKTLLQQALIESKASEESTRMVAMENATKNADEMIRKLNIEFNRNRQASITKELIEIISGAEAV
ncbi:MAG: ATP synthase F1 subunit gamma [Alphaproteobacteria bacterium]|nr:MAG: ATP synthase F1 subunit gamma [Alphaproteobacteria bacterium]